jgi:hypothetical protein
LRLLEEAKARALAVATAEAAPAAITLGQAGLLPAGHAHYESARVPEPPMLTQQQLENLSEYSKEHYRARVHAYKEQQRRLAQYRASLAAHQAALLEQQQQQLLQRDAVARKEQ